MVWQTCPPVRSASSWSVASGCCSTSRRSRRAALPVKTRGLPGRPYRDHRAEAEGFWKLPPGGSVSHVFGLRCLCDPQKLPSPSVCSTGTRLPTSGLPVDTTPYQCPGNEPWTSLCAGLLLLLEKRFGFCNQAAPIFLCQRSLELLLLASAEHKGIHRVFSGQCLQKVAICPAIAALGRQRHARARLGLKVPHGTASPRVTVLHRIGHQRTGQDQGLGVISCTPAGILADDPVGRRGGLEFHVLARNRKAFHGRSVGHGSHLLIERQDNGAVLHLSFP